MEPIQTDRKKLAAPLDFIKVDQTAGLFSQIRQRDLHSIQTLLQKGKGFRRNEQDCTLSLYVCSKCIYVGHPA